MQSIALIDVDGHNRKTRWGSAFPNLALMKLSAYHKSIGDHVEWAAPGQHYDVLYASKIFKSSPDITFDPSPQPSPRVGGSGQSCDVKITLPTNCNKSNSLSAKKSLPTNCNQSPSLEEGLWDGSLWASVVVKGGTGYSLTTVLPDHIDRLQPDYSIYPFIRDREAYGFLTRGCPNRCKWCVVPQKEGLIRPYMTADEVAQNGKRPYLTLMDNNILAAGDYAMEQLEVIIHRGYHVDFNQAMDARLVTPENARLLARIKWFPYIRFGCDTHAQIAHCERALDLLRTEGWHGNAFLYCMITDDFDESVHRVLHWRDRLMRGEKTYPHVQPYLDFNDPTYLPPKWQKDMARWCGVKSLLKTVPLMDYQPRQGFLFSEYDMHPELRQCRTKEEIAEILSFPTL